ncbi:MAG: dihydrofolate reductase family protein [Candidatus Melainabacteria bacterium]|nr:dihydrofolate reductase family protein [Candidatus Melainabacteria bacterium]
MNIIACFASSLDGKISTANSSSYVKLGTDTDIEHLMRVRDRADAIVFGAGTFRAFSKARQSLNQRRPRSHIILTQGWDLPLDAPLFSQQPTDTSYGDVQYPVQIASAQPAPSRFEKLLEAGRLIHLPLNGNASPAEQAHQLLVALENQGHQTVLFEGGGETMTHFLEARAIHELYLTLCPRLIGGRNTASLLGGAAGLSYPLQTEILTLQQVGQELYLHLKLHYPHTPEASSI